jgi:diguanylate cyclase (GGDEF)-like protein/PAS domain S-box-containing protein
MAQSAPLEAPREVGQESYEVRRRARALRQLLTTRISPFVEPCNDAIISKTLDGIIVTWNPAAERMFGYSAAEAVGKPISFLFPKEKRHELAPILKSIRRGERLEHYETVRVRKDGTHIDVSVTISPILGRGGKILGASVIARDITEHKKAQERIQYLATHDSLTGLLNYGAFTDALGAELRRSERSGCAFSLLLFDLDGLKAINDHYGHLVGSVALRRLAHVLQCNCRSIDAAGRYGGDEFGLLLVQTEKETALRVAERIEGQLAADHGEISLSASVGVSTYPCDGRTTETLLAAADQDLYIKKPRKPANQANPAQP